MFFRFITENASNYCFKISTKFQISFHPYPVDIFLLLILEFSSCSYIIRVFRKRYFIKLLLILEIFGIKWKNTKLISLNFFNSLILEVILFIQHCDNIQCKLKKKSRFLLIFSWIFLNLKEGGILIGLFLPFLETKNCM